MPYAASHRYAPISARKARLVLDLIRGKALGEALSIVQFNQKRAAHLVGKVLQSAQANAQEQGVGRPNELRVSRAWADEGPTRGKWRPRARGMAAPIRRRMSHINVELDMASTVAAGGEE